MRKTGFVAIVGLANAGKSTLMNALVQQKVSIVSPKPQTTRDSILGIWTDEDSQIVFVDTPGFFKSRNALGDYMLKSIDSAVSDVDCVLVVIDGHDGILRSPQKIDGEHARDDGDLALGRDPSEKDGDSGHKKHLRR